MIMTEARRKVERLRTATEQAKARVRRLTPAYQSMCYRLKINPQTGEDIIEDEEDKEGF